MKITINIVVAFSIDMEPSPRLRVCGAIFLSTPTVLESFIIFSTFAFYIFLFLQFLFFLLHSNIRNPSVHGFSSEHELLLLDGRTLQLVHARGH